jgi:low temperature requirement protein LtrA
MSASDHGAPAASRPIVQRMAARSPHEAHRAATPLELLFDLVFVVAIAQAGEGLHHAITEGHTVEGIVGYLMVFFAIWWAWMNFTWFASAYDCDDVPYRIAALVQITGALVMAGGVARMFEDRQANGAVLGGYVIMRLALVAQWLRAAAADPDHRATARRYALGVAIVQIAWLATAPLAGGYWPAVFLILALCELAVPAWAEQPGVTTWHPHHITERYGLLTIIVLGESILAATMAVKAALDSGEALTGLLPIIAGGLLIVYSMWWMYFDRPVHDLLTSMRKAFLWGYGHYLVFASVAAVGAGLAVAVDVATHHAHVSAVAGGFAVAVPVAVYLLSLWELHYRPEYRPTRAYGPVAAVLILLTPFTGQAVPLTGLVLAGLIALKLVVVPPPPTPHAM